MATVKKKELDATPGKAFNQALNKSNLYKPAPPLNSKGQPKTGGPMLGGPLSKGISNLASRISENNAKIMAQSRAIEARNQATAAAARAKTSTANPKPTRTLTAPTRSPMDSKGRPKTAEPIFGGPLGRAIANADFGSMKGAATRANAAKRGQPVAQAPARGRAATMAPLRPMSFISQPTAPKATPVAKGSQEYNPDTATRYLPPASKAAARPAAPVAKAAPKASAPVARTAAPIKPMTSLSVSASETQPMGKREVDLNISTKRGNLFQRIGERIKQRQLARANRGAGTPMKSTSSVPSTPTPSAPQTESGQKLSMVGRAMLDKYMSKKYMGGGKMEYGMGGKMKSYAKGGMIEKEGMKPKGKMDRKKAFMEMIAKLKAKKK